MTVSANIWQARAAMCELLALSFRYPEDKVLAEAIASGEWGEAADEIAGALGIDWTAAAAPVEHRRLAARSGRHPEGAAPRGYAPVRGRSRGGVQPVRGRVACEGRGRAAAAVREPALHGCGALLQGLRIGPSRGHQRALGRRVDRAGASGVPGPARGGRRHGRSGRGRCGSWRRRRAYRRAGRAVQGGRRRD